MNVYTRNMPNPHYISSHTEHSRPHAIEFFSPLILKSMSTWERNPKKKGSLSLWIPILVYRNHNITLLRSPNPYLREACVASANPAESRRPVPAHCSASHRRRRLRRRQSHRRWPWRPAATPSRADCRRSPSAARGGRRGASWDAAASRRRSCCRPCPSRAAAAAARPTWRTRGAELGFCGAYSTPRRPRTKLRPEPPWPNAERTRPSPPPMNHQNLSLSL